MLILNIWLILRILSYERLSYFPLNHDSKEFYTTLDIEPLLRIMCMWLMPLPFAITRPYCY